MEWRNGCGQLFAGIYGEHAADRGNRVGIPALSDHAQAVGQAGIPYLLFFAGRGVWKDQEQEEICMAPVPFCANF